MNFYRVLLVDDEEEIRAGISKHMQWEAHGFHLVGEAENGAEALELAEQLRPDVVLTDIKMPFMDGLTLCRHLKTQLPAAQIVIFSGFDDFEYARQAIGMNVFEYILKPISAAELGRVLDTLRNQLDKTHAEQQNMDTLRKRYEESLPVLREVFYTRLLDGWIKPEQVRGRAQRYDIDLPMGFWAVALVDISASFEDALAGSNELLLFAVRSFLKEQFTVEGCSIRPILYNDTVAVLVSLGQNDSIYPFIQEMQRICVLARSYLGLTLTTGIGRVCTGVESLSNSATQAELALEYRVLLGNDKVIYLGDLEPNNSLSLSFDEGDERQLSSVLKLGNEEQVQSFLADLIERVRQTGLTMSQCHFFFLELITALVRLARSADIPLETVFEGENASALQISDFGSLEKLEEWCKGCFFRLREALSSQRSNSTWSLVEQAKNLIHEKFADDELSVEMLCAHLHISPAYFSTLFKRETGLGFSAYVTNVRMEAAKRLLQESTDKTYIIAAKVGYADPNYFSYVFKRHLGISPSRFRSGTMENQD